MKRKCGGSSFAAKDDRETLAAVMASEVGNNFIRGEGEKTPRW